MTEMREPAAEPPVAFDFRASLKRRRSITFFGFFDDYLNRPLAALLVKVVYRTRVTPNQLSLISALIGLIGAGLIVPASHLSLILAAVLCQIASVVDGADGMLARAKGLVSEYGAMLDLFLDRLVDFSVFVGIALGHYHRFHASLFLIIGLIGAGLYQVQIIFFYLLNDFRKVKDSGVNGEIRAFMFWLILVYAVFNRLDFMILTLIGETAINTSIRIVQCLRLGRR